MIICHEWRCGVDMEQENNNFDPFEKFIIKMKELVKIDPLVKIKLR
jgi:hypothetical protein